MAGKLLLIAGILGLIVGVGTMVVMAVLMAGGGHVSTEEGILPLIGGGCCSFMSLVLGVLGLVLIMKGKKNPPSTPSTPPANKV